MESNSKEELYQEVLDYNSEYKKAIKELMKIEDVNAVLSPLTALIMQYIENHLKAILQDYFQIEKTAHDLEIDNHKTRNLLNDVKEKYKRYLTIDSVNNQLLTIEECINYMEGIYGEDTMINARYPINKKVLKVNRKEHTIISEEYKLMFLMLRYALEHLIQFYELEKIYQKIISTSKPKEQLQDFIDFCNKEFDYPKSIVKIGIISKIDKCNANILDEK